MSAISKVSRGTAALCGTWMLSVVLCSADSPTQPAQPSDNSRPFEAKVLNGEEVGWEQKRRILLKCGTNEMVFLIPDGLRAQLAEAKVTLSAHDAGLFLSLRIRTETVSEDKPAEIDAARQRLLTQYAGARIMDEYPVSALDRTGRAYELRWKPAGVAERSLRVARIPIEAGMLELTLIAESSKSAEGTFAFNSILTTMCKAKDGKFAVVRATGGS